MAKQLFANNAKGRLNSGITGGSGSITVQAGQGALFPNPSGGDWFLVTLVNTSGQIEIVKVTTRGGDTFSVIERAQEGTLALSFAANDPVELRWTKGSIELLRDNLMAPVGTRMAFQQTAVPLYWTKETSAAYNDAALRLVTGTIGTGGADAFSAHFGTGKATAGHALTEAEGPTHTHGVNDPGHFHDQYTESRGGAQAGLGFLGDISGPGGVSPYADTGIKVTGITLQNSGMGDAHSHDLDDFDIKYADFVIGTKD